MACPRRQCSSGNKARDGQMQLVRSCWKSSIPTQTWSRQQPSVESGRHDYGRSVERRMTACQDGTGHIGFSTCSTGRFFELDMISWGDIAALERTALAFVTSLLDFDQKSIASVATTISTARPMYLRMESLHYRGPVMPARLRGFAKRVCDANHRVSGFIGTGYTRTVGTIAWPSPIIRRGREKVEFASGQQAARLP